MTSREEVPLTADLSRIFNLVERWVTEAPDREALAFGDQSWTWAQLDDRIRRAAGALRASGLGPGDRLAVLERTTRRASNSRSRLRLSAPLTWWSASVCHARN